MERLPPQKLHLCWLQLPLPLQLPSQKLHLCWLQLQLRLPLPRQQSPHPQHQQRWTQHLQVLITVQTAELLQTAAMNWSLV